MSNNPGSEKLKKLQLSGWAAQKKLFRLKKNVEKEMEQADI